MVVWSFVIASIYLAISILCVIAVTHVLTTWLQLCFYNETQACMLDLIERKASMSDLNDKNSMQR